MARWYISIRWGSVTLAFRVMNTRSRPMSHTSLFESNCYSSTPWRTTAFHRPIRQFSWCHLPTSKQSNNVIENRHLFARFFVDEMSIAMVLSSFHPRKGVHEKANLPWHDSTFFAGSPFFGKTWFSRREIRILKMFRAFSLRVKHPQVLAAAGKECGQLIWQFVWVQGTTNRPGIQRITSFLARRNYVE